MLFAAKISKRQVCLQIRKTPTHHKAIPNSNRMDSLDGPDEVVLSYHETLLRRSDVVVLLGPLWLNDQIISFYLEYLEHDRFAHVKDSVLFVSPDVTQCLKMLPRNEMSIFLDPLNATEKSFVFFPLNDHQFDSAGGTHWSLVVYSRPDQKFLYIDSAKGSNWSTSKRFASNVYKALGCALEGVTLDAVPCFQQENSYDCGIHVLYNIEKVAEYAVDKGTLEELTEIMDGMRPVGKREEIRALIEQLAEKK